MRVARGLTLVEVLIATAILAMVSIACLPLLQQGLAHLAVPPPANFELDELSEAADRFLTDPTSFGITDVGELIKQGDAVFSWPHPKDAAQDVGASIEPRPPILVRCLLPNDPKANHAWAIFECDGQSVARWIALPPKEHTGP